MSDVAIILTAVFALGGLALLGIPVWRATAGAAGWVKGLVWVGFVVAALAIAAAGLLTLDDAREVSSASPAPSAGAPPSDSAPGPVAEAPTSPPKKAKPPEPAGAGGGGEQSSGESGQYPDAAPPPAGGSASPSVDESAREFEALEQEKALAEERTRTDTNAGASRGLGGAAREPDSAAREPAGGAAPPPAPAPAPALPPPAVGAPKPDDAAKTEWDVVPVYYGTDRARADQADRADYGNERGRRLELGRALVTVPRSHTIPQIERPWSVHIPYFDVTIGESEDPNTHFTMQEVKPLTRDEFLDLVRTRLAASSRFKKHALIFVHGFNTTFDFAIYRTAQIAYDLKFDGAPFCYSWPSGGGLASYTFDRERSEQSVKFLRDYIEMVLDQTGAEAVSVVAHSMGNQPLLQVLKDLKAARPKGLVFNQIILAAPDVDRDSFGDIADALQGLAKNITLYAAENDTALSVSRRVNGGPRAGDIPAQGPLVIPGVDTLDVTSVSTDSLGIHHSGYAENNKLLADIELLVSKGEAPGVRMPSLEVVPLGTGQYWRFPKVPPAPPH